MDMILANTLDVILGPDCSQCKLQHMPLCPAKATSILPVRDMTVFWPQLLDGKPSTGLLLESFFFYLASFTAFIVSYQSRSVILVGQLFTFWNYMETFGGQSVEKWLKGKWGR